MGRWYKMCNEEVAVELRAKQCSAVQFLRVTAEV